MRLLQSAALALCLVACASPRGARVGGVLGARAPQGRVALDLLRPWPGADKIYVQVGLPGDMKGVFLVDTGASTSLLSAEMAQTLGIEGRDNGQIIAGLGGTATMYEGRLPFVDLAGLRVEDVAVAVGAPSIGPFSSWVPLDGILGNNVWGRLQVAIDYPADRMELAWPGGLEIPEDASHLLVPVTLRAGEAGGETVIERNLLLELDTGARGVMLTEFTGPGFEAVATDAEEPILGVGAPDYLPMSSFYRPTRRVPLLRVDIGGASVEDPGPATWLNIDGRSRGLEMLGLVGYSVLRDHRLVLDFPGGRFALGESLGPARQVDGHQLLLEADEAAHGRDPERGLFRAGMRLALDDREAALVELDRYLKRRPADPEALITRARVLRVEGDLDGYWSSVQAVEPGALVDQAELLAAANWASLSGRGEEALALGARAIEARPESPLAWLARAATLYASRARGGALRGLSPDAARQVGVLAQPLRDDAHLLREWGNLPLQLRVLPRLGNRVADHARGLSAEAARAHRALVVDLGDALLVVGVRAGLLAGHEARAHPDPHRPHGQHGGQAASVRDAPGRQHRHIHGVDHCGHQRHAAHPTRVPAAVVALGDHRVDTACGHAAGVLGVAHDGEHTNPQLVGAWNRGARVAQAAHQHGHAFLEDHLHEVLHPAGQRPRGIALSQRRGKEDVHPEWPVGPLSDLSDVVPQLVRGERGRTDHPQAPGFGDRRSQLGARDETHAGLEDGELDPEQLAGGGVQGGVRHDVPPRSRSPTTRSPNRDS